MASPFWTDYGIPTAIIVAQIVAIIVPILVGVAFLTLMERKVIAAMQLRKGPNVVGPFGLLQPVADGVKLLFKETVIPSGANRAVFIAAPMVTFLLALVAWAVIPFQEGWVLADINVGVLYLFAISSLGVYGIIMAGWASNSKYPFLGALRSAAQMVSYEVSIGFVIITVHLRTRWVRFLTASMARTSSRRSSPSLCRTRVQLSSGRRCRSRLNTSWVQSFQESAGNRALRQQVVQ